MPNNAEIREAYATLIHDNSPWGFYTTVTYRIQRRDPLRAADRLWDVLENKFDAERAFVAAEYHKYGGVHLHVLSCHSERPNLNPTSMWKYLHKAFGRTTVEVPRYSSTALVSWYCSKYVTKGDCDFQFYGDPCTWITGK